VNAFVFVVTLFRFRVHIFQCLARLKNIGTVIGKLTSISVLLNFFNEIKINDNYQTAAVH